jgi:hypothetical protein
VKKKSLQELVPLARKHKIQRIFSGLLALLLVTMIAACRGDDKNGKTPAPPPPTPTATPDEGGQVIDVSNNPMPRGVLSKDNLTLLAAKHFVKGDRVYMMFVVRNDGADIVKTVKAVVSFIDVDDLRLNTVNLTTGFSNIPPGQVVALQGNYPIPEYYDGISALVIAEAGEFPGLRAYLNAQVAAELDATSSKVTGTAINVDADPLVLPVAYFVLYGESAQDVLAVIPAVLVSGTDAQGFWQPGVSLNYEATIDIIAGDNLAAVTEVQLLVAGYVIEPAS